MEFPKFPKLFNKTAKRNRATLVTHVEEGEVEGVESLIIRHPNGKVSNPSFCRKEETFSSPLIEIRFQSGRND